jgi:protoporphyrinogen IX oxidase
MLHKVPKVMSLEAFRLIIEIPALFLLLIVLLAIYKNMLNIGYTFAGVLIFGIVLFLFLKIYKRISLKN